MTNSHPCGYSPRVSPEETKSVDIYIDLDFKHENRCMNNMQTDMLHLRAYNAKLGTFIARSYFLFIASTLAFVAPPAKKLLLFNLKN